MPGPPPISGGGSSGGVGQSLPAGIPATIEQAATVAAPSAEGASPGNPVLQGVQVVTSIMAAASGTVTTTAAQIFSTPSYARRSVAIVNCDSANDLYIGHDSGLLPTKFRVKLAAGESIELPWGASVDIWLYGSAANTDYYACEQFEIVG